MVCNVTTGMSSSRDFRDYVVGDLLSGVDGISSRAMFGGFGLYRGGKVFAFILANELYLKAQGEESEVKCNTTSCTVSHRAWTTPSSG